MISGKTVPYLVGKSRENFRLNSRFHPDKYRDTKATKYFFIYFLFVYLVKTFVPLVVKYNAVIFCMFITK
jgi:hypothetical protein